MHPTTLTNQFATLAGTLCGLIARHGHLRRLAGPLVALLWGRVQGINAQVAALLVRMQTGQLRRYPARRKPRKSTAPRRRPAASGLPRKSAWLIALLPETAACGTQLQILLAAPEVPGLLAAAPQLRRTLRPLCRMLGVTLPPPPPPETPPPPHDAAPPDAPTAPAAVADTRRPRPRRYRTSRASSRRWPRWPGQPSPWRWPCPHLRHGAPVRGRACASPPNAGTCPVRSSGGASGGASPRSARQ